MRRNIIVFDTETTGVGIKDEVIQFCGILLEQRDDRLTIAKVVNFYCDTNKHIPQDAINVHGIDNKLLYELSEGKYFEECISSFSEFINPTIPTLYMSYGISFDKRLINQTLEQNGYSPIDFGNTLSSMPVDMKVNSNICLLQLCSQIYNNSYKIKLASLLNKEPLKKTLDLLYNKLKAACKIKTANDTYHDAFYDTVACLVILMHSKLYLSY